ncbi:MAG: hypothetical protein ABIW79_08815 [Gemmatimonas sp.]
MTLVARMASLGMLAGAAWGCADGGRGATPPVAEFLVAAGDSTYWVRSGPAGIRVRSAPILLTDVDGRFFEVYIAENGVEYADASFGSARVWSRELLSPDSVLLSRDSTVVTQANKWKRRHPRERPIDADDEEMTDDPTTMVTEAIEIVDVHGPWLTFTHVLDVDTEIHDPHVHAGRRAVVDVRTGQLASLAALFGSAEASRLLIAGRVSLAHLTDSIRSAQDERAELARESIETFRFDSTSFAITDIDRRPAVAFMVSGRGADDEAVALHLPPIEVGTPSWWARVHPTLPEWKGDSSEVRWQRNGYRVVARPSPDGETLALVLQANSRGDSGSASPSQSGNAGRDWPLASVASPAYQLIALDDPPVIGPVRAALARAFDVSTALDGITQRASYSRPSTLPRVRKGRRAPSRSPIRVVRHW